MYSRSISSASAFRASSSLNITLPISLGGLGVREGTYQLLFGQVGVPGAVAVSLSLAVYLINALSGLIGGAMYAWEGAYGAWRQAREEP